MPDARPNPQTEPISEAVESPDPTADQPLQPPSSAELASRPITPTPPPDKTSGEIPSEVPRESEFPRETEPTSADRVIELDPDVPLPQGPAAVPLPPVRKAPQPPPPPEPETSDLPASAPPASESAADTVPASDSDVSDELEVADDIVEAQIIRSLPARLWSGICYATHWLFGVATLIAGLAFLATFPILQFLSLGYLLESAGRIARSGRIRDGFVGVDKAARVGSLVLGTWLCLLPLRFFSDMWYSSHLIDPGSGITRAWRIFLLITTVMGIAHVLWAWYRGGKFRHFLWPAPLRLFRELRRGGKYVRARDAVWDFVVSLRLPHYFWLGLRGFAGAVAWLFVPIMLFIGATTLPPPVGVLLGLLGAALFSVVLLYLPFVQVHFAAENRFEAMFELSTVRAQFRRAPIAFASSLLITLLFALPLYLLKIELTPREVAALPSLVFVAFIFPARLLSGWAVGRARRRETPRHFVFRWFGRLAGIPIVGFYVFVVFFTRYTSWNGVWSLFEQHAFLVPVPFLGL